MARRTSRSGGSRRTSTGTSTSSRITTGGCSASSSASRTRRRRRRCSRRAEEWLRERGRDRMVGPMDFTTNDECGVLIDGYDLLPTILTNWHHPYYPELIEGYGLTKAMDLYMWDLKVHERDKVHPAIWRAAAEVESKYGIIGPVDAQEGHGGRDRSFPRGLQRRLGAQLGVRAADRGRGPPLRQGPQADPRRELGVRRREGWRDDRSRADACPTTTRC